MVLAVAAFADERPAEQTIQEEVWAIPVTLPTIAYVVRPVGKGPFPLVVINHGVSLNQKERGFFPLVEFRDAAMWFAKRGYMVVAPTGTGYGAAALDDPERGFCNCDNPNFRDAGGRRTERRPARLAVLLSVLLFSPSL
jgi:dienelactone hydrolase